MNDYIALYLNSEIALGSPEDLMALFLVGIARLFPVIMLSPFFGSRTLPFPVKVALSISLFMVFFPTLVVNLSQPIVFNFRFFWLVFKELFIGLGIGWIMSMPFMIVQSVGMIVDHQRGGASLMVNDPSVQTQSSPLGTVYNLILIVVFYSIGGPFYFIEAINTSYVIMPPDRLLNNAFFRNSVDFWDIQIKLLNTFMVQAVQLVSPPLISVLMTDMFLGITNRLAPQVQITFLGLPLKSLIALLVIWLGWKAYNDETIVLVFKWLDILKNSIFSLAVGAG